jgi:hypothetical protein
MLMSLTVNGATPEPYPGADAEMSATLGPVGTPGFTPVTVNVLLAEPFGIVTVAGTLAAFVKVLASETVKAFVGNVFRVTVPVVEPFSAINEFPRLTASAGPLLSVTVIVAVDEVAGIGVAESASETCATTTATRSPVTRLSCTTFTGKVAFVTLGGSVTEEGIEIAGLIVCRRIVTACVVARLAVNIPCVAGLAAPLETTVSAKLNVNTGASSSTIVIDPAWLA